MQLIKKCKAGSTVLLGQDHMKLWYKFPVAQMVKNPPTAHGVAESQTQLRKHTSGETEIKRL